MENFKLLGVKMRYMTESQAVNEIQRLAISARGAVIYTPNSLILNKASRAPSLVSLLNSADLLLPDGAGISLALWLRGLPTPSRIAGIDAAYSLLQFAEKEGLTVYLLGGKLGVAYSAARNLKVLLPNLKICGTHHGYFDKTLDSKDNLKILSDIRTASPDILFVCFGFPTQEMWIKDNAASLPSVRVFMGLGGSLDVWAGRISRAPRLMQRAGLEWLWRCIKQPRRFRDAVSLPVFIFKAIKKEK